MDLISQFANSKKPRIGLTPLIDVVFILLVFFYVSYNVYGFIT